MRRVVVTAVSLLGIIAGLTGTAAANPPGAVDNSCSMAASWWDPGTGPGSAVGLDGRARGMFLVHSMEPYTRGASNMDIICPA
jgi:hypothetical protein